MRKLLDADDPFFAKPWRRWATTALPLAWAAFEWWTGSPLWALLFGFLGVWAWYELIFKGPQGK
jgi:hypothetical protein